MVDEGEFKKQLATLRREAVKEIQSYHHSRHELGRHEYISLMLDDAKKEFPQCSTCKFLDCYFIHQRGSYYSLCPPRKEWFVKWFGSEETKG